MESARRVTLSLAGFVLICFFPPWIQLSCVGLKDSASGFDLARQRDSLLWLVPSFMFVILVLGIVRAFWDKLPAVFALTATVGGSISAYLMCRERSGLNESRRDGCGAAGLHCSGLPFWLLSALPQRHSYSTQSASRAPWRQFPCCLGRHYRISHVTQRYHRINFRCSPVRE